MNYSVVFPTIAAAEHLATSFSTV